MPELYYRRVVHRGVRPDPAYPDDPKTNRLDDTVDIFFVPTSRNPFSRKGFSLEIHRGYDDLVVFQRFDSYRRKINPGIDVPRTAAQWYQGLRDRISWRRAMNITDNSEVLEEATIQITGKYMNALRRTAYANSQRLDQGEGTAIIVNNILTLFPRTSTMDRLPYRKAAN